MSLNYKEINLILEELDLTGSRIQEIYQPAPPQLIFDLYKPQRSFKLFISLAPSFCRLHSYEGKVAKRAKPLRFAEFLKSNLRNGRIVKVEQLGKERIIQLSVVKDSTPYEVWIRLWSSAANIIVTDQEGKILDALYRRPQRGEITGAYYNPTENIEQTKNKAATGKEFTVRELPGEGSFNEKIAAWYFSHEHELTAENRTKNILKQLTVRENTLLATLEKLSAKKAEFSLCERWRELGELLKNNIYKIEAHTQWVSVEDYFHDNQTVEIELDPRLDAVQNAEHYFKRFKKEKAGLSRLNEDIAALTAELKEVQAGLAALQTETTEGSLSEGVKEALAVAQANRSPKDRTSEELPGLVFQSGPFRLIVGRKSEENDQLLRRYVKGNDYWLHARDYPGAYVFINTNKGKSVPLDVMLDAANLALLYSKGKKSGQGDIYYTQVKYLRRAKNAKLGTVLPTREKNIFVKLDMERLKRLFNSKDGIEIQNEMHIL